MQILNETEIYTAQKLFNILKRKVLTNSLYIYEHLHIHVMEVFSHICSKQDIHPSRKSIIVVIYIYM